MTFFKKFSINTSVQISCFTGFSSYYLSCYLLSGIIEIQETKLHVIGQGFAGGGGLDRVRGMLECVHISRCSVSSQRREAVCGPQCKHPNTGGRKVRDNRVGHPSAAHPHWRNSARLGKQRDYSHPATTWQILFPIICIKICKIVIEHFQPLSFL